jgi:hypothetical protein
VKYVRPVVIALGARARTARGANPLPVADACAAGDSPVDVNDLTCFDCYAGFSAATCLHGACPTDDGGGCRNGTSFH